MMMTTFESYWEEGFSALEKFKARTGQCNVPLKHCEGKFPLGVWVSNQRRYSMSAERRQRLNKIGFVWDAFEEYVGIKNSDKIH